MRALITLLLIYSINAYSILGGGDIINNGGGLAETNFINAYSRLYKIIESCLNSDFCVRSGREFSDLSAIQKIAKNNLNNLSRLRFKSSTKHPQLFYTADSDEIRLAVTGLKPTDPIYVNLDLLYSVKNGIKFPGITFGEMVSMLVHEHGHNAGFKHHAYLDYLGSLVRHFIEQRSLDNKYVVNKTLFSVYLINFVKEERLSEFWINWSDKSFDITDKVYMSVVCENGEKPFSIKFNNFHEEKMTNKNGREIKPINVWAQLICMDGPITHNEIVDVYIYLGTSKKDGVGFVDVKVKEL